MDTLVAFGITSNFYAFVERLDRVCKIEYFSDNNSRYWGQYLLGDERICISPEKIQMLNSPCVIIFCEKESSIAAVEKQFDAMGIKHKRVNELICECVFKPVETHWLQSIQRKRIHKFIELLVHGTTECNFKCEYCYVWTTNDFTHKTETSQYTPKELRRALSVGRLGGPCHINACALGETLLSREIVELVHELLEEGHYVSVITNGTVTAKIEQMLEFPPELQERLFFKLSFHYAELKKRKLLQRFWDNTDKIRESACSYSIEITPCDHLIGELDEIRKQFKENANGAMPHITFTRDGNKAGLDLLSELPLQEYIDTWNVFDSDLFHLKCSLYKRKICENCYAGSWSYRINSMNGNLQSCYKQNLKGTIFDHEQQILPVMTVGRHCQMDYCFNNHAFLAWGDAPEIECATYFEMRNRTDSEGNQWIKSTYAAAMKQKLYDNNFAYLDKWSDYEKLMNPDRKAGFILFNSPDYSNLGDHAIALAEREFLENLFPNIPVIEISCEQYIKENILIQNVIKPEDILIISGGGYLGSLWLWLEDITKDIIRVYRDNQILIFPQTIYFEENSLGAVEKSALAEVVNSHDNLTIFLREKQSYELAKRLFGANIKKICMPDMAFNLKFQALGKRDGAIVCMRKDKESRGCDTAEIENALRKRRFKISHLSTVADKNIYLNERAGAVAELLQTIGAAQLVVTDRLHAMIFCAVTNTPCIALDNLSGKISQTYEWIKENQRIVFCSSLEKLEEDLDWVLCAADADEEAVEYQGITAEFEKMKAYLKESYD